MPTDDSATGLPAKPPEGIHILRGMHVSVAKFTISMADDGSITTDLALELSLDLCPHWLAIAKRHVDAAERQHIEVLAAWESTDEGRRASALEAEFESAMQAIAAAGIAIDAFYAATKERIELPADLIPSWKENNTARFKQVAEVLRRAFKMGNRSAVNLRRAIKEIYRFRDFTVHPPAEARSPVRYAELGTATEWRFETFRGSIARTLVGLSISIVAQLLEAPRGPNKELADYCSAASGRVRPLLEEWEAQYGQLFPRQVGAVEIAGSEVTEQS